MLEWKVIDEPLPQARPGEVALLADDAGQRIPSRQPPHPIQPRQVTDLQSHAAIYINLITVPCSLWSTINHRIKYQLIRQM